MVEEHVRSVPKKVAIVPVIVKLLDEKLSAPSVNVAVIVLLDNFEIKEAIVSVVLTVIVLRVEPLLFLTKQVELLVKPSSANVVSRVAVVVIVVTASYVIALAEVAELITVVEVV